jgi:ATP-dependent Lon protease
MEETLLPLFPLEVVLLPEETLPLHIFEERYKEMIGECLKAKASGAGQQEFGVVLAKGQEIYSVGCTALIVNLTRQYADGRMDILTVGKRRFEIALTNDEKDYLRGSVEFFDDDKADTPSDALAQRATELFREIMRKLRRSADMPIHLSRPYRHLSFRLAAPLLLELDFKQQLLSMRDEPQRLQVLIEVMQRLGPRLDTAEKARSKAGGNGNIHKS